MINKNYSKELWRTNAAACFKSLLLLGVLISSFTTSKLSAQVPLFFERIGTVTGTTTYATHNTNTGFNNDQATESSMVLSYGNGGLAAEGDIRSTASINTETNDANVFFTTTAATRGFQIGNINTTNYSNLKLSFRYNKLVALNLPALVLEYSTNGTTYNSITYSFAEAANAATGWYLVGPISLPAACANQANLRLRWNITTSATSTMRLDEIYLEGTPTNAQNLPYAQNFGTTTFTSMPTGWFGVNHPISLGDVTRPYTTQVVAEATSPRSGVAPITAATAAQTSGGLYGYNATSTTDASLYFQSNNGNTNSMSQAYLTINTGSLTSVRVSYDLEVIQPGTLGNTQSFALQYKLASAASWSSANTVAGSAVDFAAPVSAGGSYVFDITGLTASTDYVFRWITWGTVPSSPRVGMGLDNVSITSIPNPAVVLSAAHPAAGNINQGSTDNPIAAYSLAVTGSNATINAISVTTAGTYQASDITNFKFWTSTDGITLGTQLGTTQTSVASGGTVGVSGLSYTVNYGTTRYIIVTASVSGTAVTTRTLNLTSLAASGVTVASPGTISGTAAASNTQTIVAVPSSIALAGVSPAAGTINQNSTNQVLYSVSLSTTVASSQLTSASFTTAGTYLSSDLQANSFKLWINSSNSIAGATQIGTAQAVVSSGGTISFTGLTSTLPISSVRYLLVTCDVAYNANTSRNISIASTAFTNFTFVNATLSGTNPVAVGNAQTFGAVASSMTPVTLIAPVAAGSFNLPATNGILHNFSFVVTGNSTQLNSITYTTAGTYLTSDFTATSFKLWFSTTNTFASASQIGTAQAVPTSGGTVTFSGLTQFVALGSTGYLWLTADGPANPSNSRTVNIAALTTGNVVFSNGTLATGTAAASVLTFNTVPTVTELIMPRYAVNGGTTATRLPYVCRIRLSNLRPSATYRYYPVNGGGGAGNFYVINNVSGSAGYITGYSSGKSFTGSLMGTNENTTSSRYGEFSSDASGIYEGWFCIVPTGNAVFNAGLTFTFGIALNDGLGGTAIANSVAGTSAITVLQPNATGNNTTPIYCTSDATPENMVFIYDNTAASGRPAYGTFVESDGVGSGFSTWYGPNVETGAAGRFGFVIPSNDPNGVRSIVQYNVATGAQAGCPVTSSTGVWSGIPTANQPASVSTPILLSNLVFTAPTWYADADGDTFGNPSVSQQACTQPLGYVSNSLDCNDACSSCRPGGIEVCDGLDNDCDGLTDEGFDLDSDGYTSCGGDCDDNNPTVYPGAAEICDGLDNNCNTLIDEVTPNWYADNDGDGFGAGVILISSCTSPGGNAVSNNLDCDDTSAAINPNTIWYKDTDNDGYSDGTTLTQCAQPVGYKLATQLTATSGDCNDNNAALNPATIWYRDGDGDTYGDPATTLIQCTQPAGYVSNNQDCNDNSASIKPGATEIACNGIDENCNGIIDADAAGAVLGCTDPAASNYIASANCEDGSCTYTSTYTPGNLVVLRVGTGTSALTNGSTQVVIDQYNNSTANQSNPVSSRRVPSGGPAVLTVSGTATSEGQITRSPDGQSIVLAGYGAYLGVGAVVGTQSSSIPRVIGQLDINNNFSRLASSSTYYSGNNIRSATKNGTDYWAAGPGSSTQPGIAYFGSGTPALVNNTPINNFRVVSVQNGKLYGSTASGTAPNNRGIYQFGTVLPTTTAAAQAVISDASNTTSMYAFQFNPAETICFVADDRTTAGGGIQKWVKSAGVWSLSYTVSVGASTGATGVYVDYFGGATPIVYAVTTASTGTRIVKFVDNGTSTPAITTLATAPTNTAFRSVTLAPCTDLVWYRDADGDGYGDISNTFLYCTQPFGYVANSTDCNDADATINPATVWYKDVDGDGYSDGSTLIQCLQPTNYYLAGDLAATNGDCNDNNAAQNPGATEVCNGIDDNCNGQFDENTLTVTVTSTGVGTVSPAGPVTLNCGGSQLFNFNADPCWQVSDIQVDGVSVGNGLTYNLTNVTANKTVNVVFTQRVYNINVTSSANGSNSGPSTVLCGNDASVFFTADPCYEIASLTLNGSPITGAVGRTTYQLDLNNVTATQNISVNYVITQYQISASVSTTNGAVGSISPSGTYNVNCGTSQTFNITVDGCSFIQDVVVNGISFGQVSTFTLNNIQTNYDIFVSVGRLSYTVTATATVGGSISPSGTVTYFCGATPTYTISPAVGYAIAGVTVNGTPIGALTSYTLPALSGNVTINATFAPQPYNNSWSVPALSIAPTYPSCFYQNGTLAGSTPSPEASYVGFPAGSGQDIWYRFQIPSTSAGIVRIQCTTTANDIALVLQQESAVSPFYTAVAQENAVTGIGNEFMTVSGLVPGTVYRLAVKNVGLQTAGAFQLCIMNVRSMSCGTVTTPTSTKSLCDLFLGAYTGANSYTFTFTNASNPSEVYTKTLTGVSGAAANTAVSLESVQGLRYGATYNVKIDATYNFVNGAGNNFPITVPGGNPTCLLYTSPQPNTELSVSDYCAAGPKLLGSFLSTTWVCGAIDYQWEITPTVGLPVPVTTLRGAASRFIRVGSLNGINGGGTTFNVRVRPIFPDGLGGTRQGNWSATARQFCLTAPAMDLYNGGSAIATEKKAVDVENIAIYPNPNQGELVNINITGMDGDIFIKVMDATGRVVANKRYVAEGGLNTIINFGTPLAAGLYTVQIQNGKEVRSERMIVQR